MGRAPHLMVSTPQPTSVKVRSWCHKVGFGVRLTGGRRVPFAQRPPRNGSVLIHRAHGEDRGNGPRAPWAISAGKSDPVSHSHHWEDLVGEKPSNPLLEEDDLLWCQVRTA